MSEQPQPYEGMTIYTLHNTRCALGWTIFMAYCRAWKAASQAREELEPGNAYLNGLVADAERALNAHKTHQSSCEQCLARNQELAEIGKETK